jgi:hypothetical protein
MPSTRIRYGDEGYDEIWEDWVTNARPRQLSREGGWGGALYRVYYPENVAWDAQTYPDFYQKSSLGPTIVDDDTGNVTQEGWHLANEKDGYRVEVTEDRDANTYGLGIKTKIKDMPDELSVEETYE